MGFVYKIYTLAQDGAFMNSKTNALPKKATSPFNFELRRVQTFYDIAGIVFIKKYCVIWKIIKFNICLRYANLLRIEATR